MPRWMTWPGPRRERDLCQPYPEAHFAVEPILDGRQASELQLDDLLDGFPLQWEGQGKSISHRN
jgi:hypothetical protein